jgi:hypothetical protein
VFDHPYAELPRAALRIGAVLEQRDQCGSAPRLRTS